MQTKAKDANKPKLNRINLFGQTIIKWDRHKDSSDRQKTSK